MNRYFSTFILILFFVNISYAQQTYFYRLVNVVINGQKKSPNTSSHLFVTYSKDICYDSDNSGYYTGYGKLRMEAENEQSIMYSGICYFGAADYVVSKNKDLINIRTSDGKVYVYKREFPNKMVTKPSYGNIENQYKSDNNIVPSIPPMNVDLETGNQQSKISSSNIPCTDCHGSTLCSWCSGKGWEDFGGTIKTCWRCNGYKYCHTCYGKGFIR